MYPFTSPRPFSQRNKQQTLPTGTSLFQSFDYLLSSLSSTFSTIHLLPGPKDPVSISLPQQPFHFSLLPKSSRFESLKRETNPSWFEESGRKILGCSGQNLDDLMKYLDGNREEEEGEGERSRIEMAKRLLEWGHVAPTAPDTLCEFLELEVGKLVRLLSLL